MFLAAVRDTTYNILLFLHIVSIVVAFAPAVVNPLTASALRGTDAFTSFVGAASTNGRRVYFPALIVAGLLGILMVVQAGDAVAFEDFWVAASLILWVALCGVVSGLILPNERRVAAGALEHEKKIDIGGQIATLIILVILYLMIFKPMP